MRTVNSPVCSPNNAQCSILTNSYVLHTKKNNCHLPAPKIQIFQPSNHKRHLLIPVPMVNPFRIAWILFSSLSHLHNFSSTVAITCLTATFSLSATDNTLAIIYSTHILVSEQQLEFIFIPPFCQHFLTILSRLTFIICIVQSYLNITISKSLTTRHHHVWYSKMCILQWTFSYEGRRHCTTLKEMPQKTPLE